MSTVDCWPAFLEERSVARVWPFFAGFCCPKSPVPLKGDQETRPMRELCVDHFHRRARDRTLHGHAAFQEDWLACGLLICHDIAQPASKIQVSNLPDDGHEGQRRRRPSSLPVKNTKNGSTNLRGAGGLVTSLKIITLVGLSHAIMSLLLTIENSLEKSKNLNIFGKMGKIPHILMDF